MQQCANAGSLFDQRYGVGSARCLRVVCGVPPRVRRLSAVLQLAWREVTGRLCGLQMVADGACGQRLGPEWRVGGQSWGGCLAVPRLIVLVLLR